MAELADALDSGSSEGDFVQVQLLLSPPENKKTLTRVFFCYSIIYFSTSQKFSIESIIPIIT